MAELDGAGFEAYFRAVHDWKPYPWQTRLTQEVLASEQWPEVIELPTGTGKTAVLDTALYALAARPEVFPRRIVFVIDRRIVVDQVYERARRIRDRLSEASDGILAELRERLNGPHGLTDANDSLGVAALRGGIPIDGEWARRPEQPWVIVSTVDQFGSRLLFRGYGVSERMRPVHAGLAGNDCLVILDEVHLSTAFAQTLHDASSTGEVPSICAVNSDLLPRRFPIVEMSATPANEHATRFRLTDADLAGSPRLKRLVEASKRATLVKVGGTRPAHETIPKKVLELIDNLKDHEKSVGVIVNRVRTARMTHAAFREKGMVAHLVTGRMRPIDRERALEAISRCVDPERHEPLQERTVVVATQAIEVGADFSFDALISEAAPIDSLRQRLGRLDRRGTLAEQRGEPARCWILGVESAMRPKLPDPVYGDAARITWEEMGTLAEDGEIEVGPGTDLLGRLSAEARAPRGEAPLLLPTHIDAWSQTSPQPIVDPPIDEFLHGKENGRDPDVFVVWRWDRSDEALALVPPRPAEFLSVPVSAVRNWIRRAAEVPVADIAAGPSEDLFARPVRDRESEQGQLRLVRRWIGCQEGLTEEIARLEQIKPGDLIIADPMLGGLRHGTWDPESRPTENLDETGGDQPGPVDDLGDAAQFAYRRRATLRLDRRLFREHSSEVPSPQQERDASEPPREAFKQWLSDLASLPSNSLPAWMAPVLEHFRTSALFDVELVPSDTDSQHDYYVLVERSVDPAVLDDFEDAPSLTGTTTTLSVHLAGVGARVADYGSRLGLTEELVEDLRLAAELHDLGKVDSRFQAQLHGHDPVCIAESDEPLAKSRPGARTTSWQWPPVRHEFGSVALVKDNPAVLDRAHDADLVLHLVGTHHGFGRPLPQIRADGQPQLLTAAGRFHDGSFRLCPVGEDDSPAQQNNGGALRMSASSDLAATPLALEMADRFWRLQERYGHHGLAWLEAILRLADHQQSAEEER